ncbi:MAG: hypothetical protein OHK0019_18490 [Saprospiraceae bacterium]
MKTRIFLLVFLIACVATSCFNLTEEYFFNADKSGRYVVTYDLSRMITMTAKSRQSFEKQRDSLIAVGAPLVIDSSFSLLARDPDSLRRLIKNPALFEKSSERMLLDYNKKQILVQTIFEFKDLAELRLIQMEWQAYQHLKDSLKTKESTPKETNSDLPASGDFQGLASEKLPELSFDGRNFSLSYQFSPGGKSDYSEIMNDDSSFGRNLLKSFKYNLVFHFPQEIKTVKGDGFTTFGKTVSFNSDFFEMMKFKDSGLKLDVKLKK